MKRRDLEKQIKAEARMAGKAVAVEHGKRHDKWTVGSTKVTIPRHTEIGPKLTFEVRRQLEPEFGKDWWR